MRVYVTTAPASTLVQLPWNTCDRHKHVLLDAAQLENKIWVCLQLSPTQGRRGDRRIHNLFSGTLEGAACGHQRFSGWLDDGKARLNFDVLFSFIRSDRHASYGIANNCTTCRESCQPSGAALDRIAQRLCAAEKVSPFLLRFHTTVRKGRTSPTTS